MPSISGLRGTGDWGTDERPKNFREMILWRQPNGMTPLTAMLSKMKEESVNDPEFSWWEEELNTIRITETVGLANNAGSTTITAASGMRDLVPGDLLLVEKTDQVAFDNEILKVTAVASDTSATVQRAYRGTMAAIAASTPLTKISNVFAEGTGAPVATTRNPTKLYNYCQIFKTAYDLTNTVMNTKARTGDPLKNDKKRKMFDHAIAMEWAFIFGVRGETVGSNGKPERTTGGIRSMLSTNVTVFTTTATETTFLDAVSPVFNFNSGGGDERIAIMGNTAMNTLNQLAKNSSSSRINFDRIIDYYGMKLQRWILPQGVIYVKNHPLLNNHARYSASMFVLDPPAMRYRYMRDTTAQDNIQNNDEDRKKGQWLSECGLELQHEKTMAYLGKLTYP